MQGLKLQPTAILEGREGRRRYIHMYVYSSRVCNAQDESEEARELQRNGVTEGGKIKAGWEMRRVASGDRSEL